MRVFLSATLVFMFCINVLAMEIGSQFTEATLENQFAEPITVSGETKWLVFVSEKDISKVVTEVLQEEKPNLEVAKVIYASDISGMPSFITKMVALPKMRKYDFKVALDKEGDVTKAWPRQPGKATLFALDNLKITEIKYLGTKAEVKDFIKTLAVQVK
ncbi:MAG: hypothetical protein HUU57_14030 [Bdellovibrio sp.]|nr:hypothetical protein [Bdellovibrio sp.]